MWILATSYTCHKTFDDQRSASHPLCPTFQVCIEEPFGTNCYICYCVIKSLDFVITIIDITFAFLVALKHLRSQATFQPKLQNTNKPIK